MQWRAGVCAGLRAVPWPRRQVRPGYCRIRYRSLTSLDIVVSLLQSLQFLSQPADWVEQRCRDHSSRVFLCRLFTKQTLVIADHAQLAQFLATAHKDFYNGEQTKHAQCSASL